VATFYPAALDVPDEVVAARVAVRPFDRGDATALQQAVEESREQIRPWLPWWNSHREVDETVEFCLRSRARWLTREDFFGGVFERSSGRLVGGAGLHPRGWPGRAFEIGYWLRSGATGQGFMREAAAALARLAFERLGAHRVAIRCDAENARSARVAEALGFVLEGHHRRDSLNPDGELRDTLVFGLVREEHDALRPRWLPLLDG
jgi:RimJ/RimL family protein N-acetyltransferase